MTRRRSESHSSDRSRYLEQDRAGSDIQITAENYGIYIINSSRELAWFAINIMINHGNVSNLNDAINNVQGSFSRSGVKPKDFSKAVARVDKEEAVRRLNSLINSKSIPVKKPIVPAQEVKDQTQHRSTAREPRTAKLEMLLSVAEEVYGDNLEKELAIIVEATDTDFTEDGSYALVDLPMCTAALVSNRAEAPTFILDTNRCGDLSLIRRDLVSRTEDELSVLLKENKGLGSVLEYSKQYNLDLHSLLSRSTG